jgi:iron complex outermembrane receptor protein
MVSYPAGHAGKAASRRRVRDWTISAGALSLALAAAAAPALAQTTPPAQASEPTVVDEIEVTGTLIKGVAPTGTNVVSVSRDEIVATGAASANDLLASIPQIGNFATLPVGTASFGLPIVRPNIRNLGGSGGSTTLVLVNGHRVVGAGVLQTTADPSIVPPDIIERVEVVPDGGSSIYGSDAIGGVVNLITRKSFDGVQANVRHGVADNYHTTDASLTAGHGWGTGSAFLAYAYAAHDNIQGIDRDYVTANHAAKGGSDFRTNACSPGNVTVGGVNYALPGRVAGTVNLCDTTDYADIYPREERHSIFGSINQELSGNVDLGLTGYWSRRHTKTNSAQVGTNGTITALNPYFRSIAGELAQSVAFSFDKVFGPSLLSRATFESYGVTPTIEVRLDNDWRVRGEVNLGRSHNAVHESTLNSSAITTALGGMTLATALNPYDPGASNPAVLAAIRDFENFGGATQDLRQVRAVADGPLFALPGGDVRLAVGVEHLYEGLDSRIALAPVGSQAGLISSDSSRKVNAIFAEVFAPLVGEANGRPGLRRLELSASVRRDDYNDVGATTNPKVGFNYAPVDELVIRGNFGTSFHAPSLADTTSTTDSRAQIVPGSPYRPSTSPITDLFRPTIVLAGGNPAIKPETADTWSLGFDWKPRALPGLTAGATFWKIKFKDAIGLAPFASPTLFTDPNYASFYIINPTLAQAKAAVGNLLINGAPNLEILYSGLTPTPYILIDARRNNLGAVHTEGVDFNLNYTIPAPFGAVSTGVSGTYTLKRDTQAIKGGAFTDALKNGTGDLAFTAYAGAKVHDLTARATLNYLGGYPILGLTNQSKVAAFKTVDLYFGYDLKTAATPDGVLLTLNIDNLFDKDPSYINTATGYANGGTLGRLVSVGARARF